MVFECFLEKYLSKGAKVLPYSKGYMVPFDLLILVQIQVE